MKLWRYIQGNRKGKEAHRIEKEAMNDPFLADALEGYEKIPGNHQRGVAKLQKRITNKSKGRKSNPLKAWSIAASILVAVGIGTWFLLDNNPSVKEDLYAIERSIQAEEALPPTATPQEKVATDSVDTVSQKSTIAQAKTNAADKKETKPIEPIAIMEEESANLMVQVEEVEERPSAPLQPEKVKTDIMMRTATADTAKDTTRAAAPPSNASTPHPVAGMDAYMDYIQRNLRRPTDEECRNAKGPVIVMFKIGQSGRPYNIRVTQGLCSSTNKEAIRLIIHGPDWKKGNASDEATITINF